MQPLTSVDNVPEDGVAGPSDANPAAPEQAPGTEVSFAPSPIRFAPKTPATSPLTGTSGCGSVEHVKFVVYATRVEEVLRGLGGNPTNTGCTGTMYWVGLVVVT